MFGSGNVIIVKENKRDIFMIDFKYESLDGTEKNKLPFYKSTGTNFSSIQKGYLSPFNGKSLLLIPYSTKNHLADMNIFYKVIYQITCY